MQVHMLASSTDRGLVHAVYILATFNDRGSVHASADPEGETGGSGLPWKITSYIGFYRE